jgi:hypothetical protein
MRVNEPLLPADAKKLAIDALARGSVIFDSHVRERMTRRKISLLDVARVIRAGVYQHATYENRSWRYPIWTQSITVVIAFRRFSPSIVAVVTVIRHGR